MRNQQIILNKNAVNIITTTQHYKL